MHNEIIMVGSSLIFIVITPIVLVIIILFIIIIFINNKYNNKYSNYYIYCFICKKMYNYRLLKNDYILMILIKCWIKSNNIFFAVT